MTSKIYSIDEIKKMVAPIAEQYGVARMFLFGSYARDETTPDSDLNFWVDKGSLRGLVQLGGLYSDLEETFDKKLDLLTTNSLEQKFLNSEPAKISNLDVLNAVLYVAENGCKWRDLPKKHGNWHVIYIRVNRWAKKCVLQAAFLCLQQLGYIPVVPSNS